MSRRAKRERSQAFIENMFFQKSPKAFSNEETMDSIYWLYCPQSSRIKAVEMAGNFLEQARNVL